MSRSNPSKKTVPTAKTHPTSTEKKEPTMSTTTHPKKSVSAPTANATTGKKEDQTVTPTGSTTSAAPTATDPSVTPTVVMGPPADANIPSVPEGVEPTNGTDYRGIVPRKAELAVLADVITELQKSTDFSTVFGRGMPSLDYIVQVFVAANAWSLMRNKTDAWDLYARTQEGLIWMTVRALMARMKPVFDATTSASSEVATEFRSLALFLNAAQVIAKRAATTRKGNAKSKAKGETPTEGAMARQVKEAAKVVADHAPAVAAPQGSSGGDAAAVSAAPAAPPAPVATANGAAHS